MALSPQKCVLPGLRRGGSGDPRLFSDAGSLPRGKQRDPGDSRQLLSALSWPREEVGPELPGADVRPEGRSWKQCRGGDDGVGVRSGCAVNRRLLSSGSGRAALCQSPLCAAGEQAPGPSFHLLPNELRQGITIKGKGEKKKKRQRDLKRLFLSFMCGSGQTY